MARKTIDILGFGLVLQAIFLIYISLLNSNMIFKIIGISGSVIVILVELIFLYEKWVK